MNTKAVPFDMRVEDALRQGIFVPGVPNQIRKYVQQYYYTKLSGGDGYTLAVYIGGDHPTVTECDCPAFLGNKAVEVRWGRSQCKHSAALQIMLSQPDRYAEIQAQLKRERAAAKKAALKL